MPRNRPDNRIYRESQITTPASRGQSITDQAGRDFRAFPPSHWSVATIARRIVDQDASRYARIKLVIREDPFPETFRDGGYDHAFWRPVIIEVRNGGNRALSRYRVACCRVANADDTRGAWSPATWARRIQFHVHDIVPPFSATRFNRAIARTNAYEVGSGIWAFQEDGDTFGHPQGNHGLTDAPSPQTTSPNPSTHGQPSRRGRRGANRPQTFADVARAMGLG